MVKIEKNGLLNWIDEYCSCGRCHKSKVCAEISGTTIVPNNNHVTDVIFTCENDNAKYSSIFSYKFNKEGNFFVDTCSPNYFTNSLIKKSKNFQGITTCKHFIVATTSLENKCEGNNNVVYWHKNKPNKVRLLNVTDCGNICDSRTVRDELINTIMLNTCNGCINYIKVEGITCISKCNRIFFAISKIGKDKHIKNVAIIISTTYTINGENLNLDKNFVISLDNDLAQTAICQNINEKKAKILQLADICYNQSNNDFLLTTKFSDGKKIGGFLFKTKWYPSIKKLGFHLKVATIKSEEKITKPVCHKKKCPKTVYLHLCKDQKNKPYYKKYKVGKECCEDSEYDKDSACCDNNTCCKDSVCCDNNTCCKDKCETVPCELCPKPQGLLCLKDNSVLIGYDHECCAKYQANKFKYEIVDYSDSFGED